jgi:hypothetical protein
MGDTKLLKTGRQLLRERPGLTEAEFRSLMLERFRESDQGLQEDRATMTGGTDPGGVGAVFALPWILFRWMGWRGRLARQRADVDGVVRILRAEGHFASA